MADFDLDSFLKNYKPKKIPIDRYLKCERLASYRILNNKNRRGVVPAQTYIKYIRVEDAFQDRDYESHIRPGGILLAGGTMDRGTFRKKDDPVSWTHLLLKYEPAHPDDDEENTEHIFPIKISNHYIFYKLFGRARNDAEFRNMAIELKKKL